MSESTYLQAIAVSRTYDDALASGVKNVSLEITPGKITAIIGASGSGKTTLLRLLYGLLSPDEGAVSFKGERIWGPEEKLIPGHDSMKMVTQHTDDLNAYARVQDNVAILLPNTNLQVKRERTNEVLRQLNMLHLAEKKIAFLSGGEKQRVAIARALVTRPEVLLLDEPFNQVDTSFREGLQQDIRRIVQETGITVVMVSHDPAEVLSMADELVVMREGRILEQGTPQSLYNAPANLYTAMLLTNCNVLENTEAELLNISSKADKVVVYPNQLKVTDNREYKKWELKQVLFKGFYEDLIFERDNSSLRVFNRDTGAYKVGEKLRLKASSWLEY